MTEEMKDIARDVRNNVERYFGTNVDIVNIEHSGITVEYYDDDHRGPLTITIAVEDESAWRFRIKFNNQKVIIGHDYHAGMDRGVFEIADPEWHNHVLSYMKEIAKRATIISSMQNDFHWKNVPTEALERVWNLMAQYKSSPPEEGEEGEDEEELNNLINQIAQDNQTKPFRR